jgi:hypothetical protein
VRRGDLPAIAGAVSALDMLCAWREGFMAVRRVTSVPSKVRERFLAIWVNHGDSIRSAVADDLVLIDGLRVLLPPYEGPAMTLYRGEGAWNRRRRTYGLSWSADRGVGESFAQGLWQTCEGGSVLLESAAPAGAIICSPAMLGTDRDEAEYLVDRRRLARVAVLQRYAQLSIDEARRRSVHGSTGA